MLALGQYPKGDVRNKPDVRAWLEAPSELGVPFTDWLRLRVGAREAKENPSVCHFTWWSWRAWLTDLDQRNVRLCNAGAEHPLSIATGAKIRALLQAVAHDLDTNRPGDFRRD